MERYELREHLGEGAQGAVYKAWDQSLNRMVAIKMLRSDRGTTEAARHRFLREARLAAGLSHPNVVQVFDAGEAHGGLCIVMELVQGLSLDRLLQTRAMDQKAALETLEKVARGVGAAHERGIVHRDLKPANILVTPEGEPKVGDFGMARLADSTSAITNAGTAMGTPLYMAPEQVRGSLEEMTPRTDVYAMGAMLYEIITGKPPFVDDTLAKLFTRILLEEPYPPRKANPKVSSALEAICLKALEKNPDLRYGNGNEFADELQRYREAKRVLAKPPGTLRKAARWVRTRPALSAAAGAVLLAGFLAIAGWMVSEAGREREIKDLLRQAAILEREGRQDDALGLYLRVLAIMPEHEEAEQGLRRIRLLREIGARPEGAKNMPVARGPSRQWRLLKRRLNVTWPEQDGSAVISDGPVEVRTAWRNSRPLPWTRATLNEVREALTRSSFAEKCVRFVVGRMSQAEEIRVSLDHGRVVSLVARSEERLEEWLTVSAPEAPEYDLDLRSRVGSVTLAPDGYAELRDHAGCAWLRMLRPIMVDAEGTPRTGKILVNGVEPDHPRLASVAIGDARKLEVRVQFDAKREPYLPALIGVSWTSTSHMATPRERHAAVLLEDERVLVACGRNTQDLLSSCEVFDPVTETWSAEASLPLSEGRHFPVLTLLKDGRVLLTGGYVPRRLWVLSTAFCLDPGGDWMPTSNPMSTGRVHHQGILLEDGRVLVLGGATMVPPNLPDDPRGGTGECDLFVPSTNSFVPTAAMNESRRAFGAIRMDDGRVLVAGGFKRNLGARDTCEIYAPDAEGGRWQAAPPLQGPRGYFSLIRLPDGGVLRSGGNDGAVSVADCEVFSEGRWISTGSMPESRGALAAEVTRSKGVILQAGGNSFGPSDEVRRYEGGRWTGPGDGVPLLNEKRDRAVAVRIEEGKLLIVGGRPDDTFVRFHTTAEIYEDERGANHRPWAPSGGVVTDGGRVQAVVSDPDGGLVRLQMELKRIGEKFNGTRLLTSEPVLSGNVAWTKSPALEPGTSHHWRVRAIDPSGATGEWVEQR
ncbi:MAG: protein kinase [Planctomycetes bacterium]|nr:protein kinase [Planctomycetota bacterium]